MAPVPKTADVSVDANGWDPVAPPSCLSNPGSCVQVNVYRDKANKNPLPNFFAQDPGARWNNGTITGSCAETGTCTCGRCANGMSGRISPFVVPVAIVDPGSAITKSGKQTVPIVNLLAFFIDPTHYQSDGTIVGWITTYPADVNPNASCRLAIRRSSIFG